jgi:hypothetical protein
MMQVVSTWQPSMVYREDQEKNEEEQQAGQADILHSFVDVAIGR